MAHLEHWDRNLTDARVLAGRRNLLTGLLGPGADGPSLIYHELPVLLAGAEPQKSVARDDHRP